MDTENPNSRLGMSDRLENAINQIEEIEEYRNLPDAFPILLFLVSGGLAARSFFWMIDFMAWLGFDKLDPAFPASISFALLFVVWVLTFLAFMSLLECMKFTNIRTFAINRLANLSLDADEVAKLNDAVKSKSWKHDRILKEVVAMLVTARQPRRRQPTGLSGK